MSLRPALLWLMVSLGTGVAARRFLSTAGAAAAAPAVVNAGGAGDSNSVRAVRKQRSRPAEAEVASGRSTEHFQNLMAWLESATAEELARMATACTALPENLSVRLVLARWAEVDAAGMMAWAATPEAHRRIESGFLENNAWEAWARVDFAAAWAAQPDAKFRCSVLLGLTASDPARALALVQSQPELLRHQRWTDMGKVLARIARRHPAEAARLASEHMTGSYWVFSGVFKAWSLTDPVAALAWARTLPSGSLGNVMDALKENLGREGQVPLTAEMGAALPPGAPRMKFEALLLTQLAQRDPAAALSNFQSLPAGMARNYSGMELLVALSRGAHQAEALTVASLLGWKLDESWHPDYRSITAPAISESRHGNTYEYREALERLAPRLAESNPEQALQAITGGASDNIVEKMLPHLVSQPEKLAEALTGSGHEESLHTALTHWMQKDAAAAAAWVSARNEHTGYSREFCFSLAQSDPQALLTWGGGGTHGEEAWSALMQHHPQLVAANLETAVAAAPEAAPRWLRKLAGQPETAMKLLQHLPAESALTDGSLYAVMEHAPEQTAQWLESLPAGKMRTTATQDMARYYSTQQEHAAAWRWAGTLPQEARAAGQAAAWSAWNAADAAAAQSAFQSLPAADQTALRQAMENPPP